MAGLKQITIIGNVGRPPEQRATQEGVPVTTFSVAVNETRKGDDTTTWFRISCWRHLAEVVAEYVSTGMLVYVTGALRTSTFVAQDGTQRFSLEVTADTVQFLSRKEGADTDRPAVAEHQEPDDLPF